MTETAVQGATPTESYGNFGLEGMVYDHLQLRVLGVDCLLDECNDRSYKTVSAMSRILLAEIHAQDAAPDALRILITKEIYEIEKLIESKAA